MTRKTGRYTLSAAVLCAMITPEAAFAAGKGYPAKTPDAGHKRAGNELYIITTNQDSVPTWFTREFPGESFSATDFRGLSYSQTVLDTNLKILRDHGIPDKRIVSNLSLAGAMAIARLSAKEAEDLRNDPRVRAVTADRASTIQSSTDQPGADSGSSKVQGRDLFPVGDFFGEDIVIGILDTGIYPEHPSFADEMVEIDADGNPSGGSNPYPAPPESWNGDGTCEFGNQDFNPEDEPFSCNNKVLAARSYVSGISRFSEDGFDSARDAFGHGTQVASIAAGNLGVSAEIDGESVGTISGVAPRARLSIYRVCTLSEPGVFSCNESAVLNAFDQAVADGVDVINFSLGSPTTGLSMQAGFSPQLEAISNAAGAGILIATAAGNGGPDEGTTENPGNLPWVTSVAALQPGDQTSVTRKVLDDSSRGPNEDTPSLIKPDIAAPGFQILAANSPFGRTDVSGERGSLFTRSSGTSFATPHVAGVFALLHQAHPAWSNAEARSALMTSARQGIVGSDGQNPADPFDVGAGLVNPRRIFRAASRAFRPGLVYDITENEYSAFVCGATTIDPFDFASSLICDLVGLQFSFDPSDLNYPSIGVSELIGQKTVARTVTSVTSDRRTFEVSVEAPEGVDIEVNPARLTLDPDETATYTVTFTVTDNAVLDEWAFGSLTWFNDNNRVRSPIAVRPIARPTP